MQRIVEMGIFATVHFQFLVMQWAGCSKNVQIFVINGMLNYPCKTNRQMGAVQIETGVFEKFYHSYKLKSLLELFRG